MTANNPESINYIPYAYSLEFQNRVHSGIRYGKNAHPDELWKTFFTSSKYIKKHRLELGDPTIKILDVFSTKEEAKDYENKYIRDYRNMDRGYNQILARNINI